MPRFNVCWVSHIAEQDQDSTSYNRQAGTALWTSAASSRSPVQCQAQDLAVRLARLRTNSLAPRSASRCWILALTVDWVATCKRFDASRKLPWAAIARKVRAYSMSIMVQTTQLHRLSSISSNMMHPALQIRRYVFTRYRIPDRVLIAYTTDLNDFPTGNPSHGTDQRGTRDAVYRATLTCTGAKTKYNVPGDRSWLTARCSRWLRFMHSSQFLSGS